MQNRPIGLAAIVLIAVGAVAGAFADEPRVPTVDDVMGLEVVRSADISPDGKHVVYVVFANDFEADKDMSQLWLVPTGGGDPVRLTYGDDSVGDYEWSVDSEWVVFLRGGKLHALRRAGGEPKTLDIDIEGMRGLQFAPDVGPSRSSPVRKTRR